MAPYLAHFGVHISKMYFFCIHYQISRTHSLSYIDGIGNHISIADLIKKPECVEYGLVALVVPIVILFALVLSTASASAALAALTLV
jgi:hypothetical protein